MDNALTIDVEEYFHPSEVQPFVSENQWDGLDSRVELQTRWVLDLLAEHDTKATFFILGWVAERRRSLVRSIADAGHEIGCHSYAHQLVYRQTPAEFRKDTERAVRAIEDSCGMTPKLYRAPSYSITRESFWALDVLVECGFSHDSSIYPISHDRYGIPGFQRQAHVITTGSGPIQEIPIASFLDSRGRAVPMGGGGYLRLLPYGYTAAGIRRVNRVEQQPACIYFHPWEIDPDQPKLATGLIARARTYTGLRGMKRKLERMITEFRFSTMGTVYSDSARTPVSTGLAS